MFRAVIVVLIAFWIGAIPFGHIIAKKSKGINIQEYGSGNIGSTNVRRVVGKKEALQTQVLDIGKGLLPTLVVMQLEGNSWLTTGADQLILLVAFATILGHDFTPFLRFKGGKGVNTTVGACLVVAPIATIIATIIYYIGKKVGKHVSVGSLLLAISLPLLYFLQHGSTNTFFFLVGAGFLIVLRHKSNISRLIAGRENQ